MPSLWPKTKYFTHQPRNISHICWKFETTWQLRIIHRFTLSSTCACVYFVQVQLLLEVIRAYVVCNVCILWFVVNTCVYDPVAFVWTCDTLKIKSIVYDLINQATPSGHFSFRLIDIVQSIGLHLVIPFLNNNVSEF